MHHVNRAWKCSPGILIIASVIANNMSQMFELCRTSEDMWQTGYAEFLYIQGSTSVCGLCDQLCGNPFSADFYIAKAVCYFLWWL